MYVSTKHTFRNLTTNMDLDLKQNWCDHLANTQTLTMLSHNVLKPVLSPTKIRGQY